MLLKRPWFSHRAYILQFLFLDFNRIDTNGLFHVLRVSVNLKSICFLIQNNIDTKYVINIKINDLNTWDKSVPILFPSLLRKGDVRFLIVYRRYRRSKTLHPFYVSVITSDTNGPYFDVCYFRPETL